METDHRFLHVLKAAKVALVLYLNSLVIDGAIRSAFLLECADPKELLPARISCYLAVFFLGLWIPFLLQSRLDCQLFPAKGSKMPIIAFCYIWTK